MVICEFGFMQEFNSSSGLLPSIQLRWLQRNSNYKKKDAKSCICNVKQNYNEFRTKPCRVYITKQRLLHCHYSCFKLSYLIPKYDVPGRFETMSTQSSWHAVLVFFANLKILFKQYKFTDECTYLVDLKESNLVC